MADQNPDPARIDPQPDDDQIPPDPLLDPGTFIHIDGECVQNGDDDVIPVTPVTPITPAVPVIESTAPLQARQMESGSEVIEGQGSAVSEATPVTQKKKRLPVELAERPSWLPADWSYEIRMRVSGATAGSYDRYYLSPTGKNFRSKTEVLHFLETGTRKKKRADADVVSPPASSENKKAKRPKRKKGDFSSVDFDFKNPPQNISWSLTNASHDIWMPVGDEVLISEAVKRSWDNTFSCITELEGKK